MRAQGRCAGCQETGPVKLVDWHVLNCAKYAELYQRDPAAALPPAAEYARWRDQDKAAEHAADLDRRVTEAVAQREASVSRFRRRDPLEEL